LLRAEIQRDPANIDAALSLTAILWREGDFKAALELISGVVERHPDNPTAHNLAGGTKLGLDDVEGARKSFEAATAANPDYLPAITNLAKLERRSGNSDRAAALYQKVLKKDPRNGAAMLALADIELGRNRKDDAIRWLEKARTESRAPGVAALRLLDLFISLGRADDALAVARDLNRTDPQNLTYVAALGRALVSARRLDEAADLFDELAIQAMARKSPDWLHRVALLQLQARDKHRAANSLQKALELDPAHVPSHFQLFRIDLEAGDLSDALARAEKVAALQPKQATGDVMLGEVHMRQGRFDLAVRAYDAALAKQPGADVATGAYRARRASGLDGLGFAIRWAAERETDPMARRLLALAYGDAGQHKEAIAIYESLDSAQSPDAVLWNNLAVLYAKIGDSRAVELARRAYESNRTEPAFIDTYGWVLLQNGKANEALPLLRSAKFRAHDVPEIRYHMAAALAALHRNDEALAEIRSALELSTTFEGADDARKLLSRLSASPGGR